MKFFINYLRLSNKIYKSSKIHSVKFIKRCENHIILNIFSFELRNVYLNEAHVYLKNPIFVSREICFEMKSFLCETTTNYFNEK